MSALAAKIAVNTVVLLLAQHPTIEKVVFVCYDGINYLEYKKVMNEL